MSLSPSSCSRRRSCPTARRPRGRLGFPSGKVSGAPGNAIVAGSRLRSHEHAVILLTSTFLAHGVLQRYRGAKDVDRRRGSNLATRKASLRPAATVFEQFRAVPELGRSCSAERVLAWKLSRGWHVQRRHEPILLFLPRTGRDRKGGSAGRYRRTGRLQRGNSGGARQVRSDAWSDCVPV